MATGNIYTGVSVNEFYIHKAMLEPHKIVIQQGIPCFQCKKISSELSACINKGNIDTLPDGSIIFVCGECNDDFPFTLMSQCHNFITNNVAETNNQSCYYQTVALDELKQLLDKEHIPYTYS